jgi:hypothetical protein
MRRTYVHEKPCDRRSRRRHWELSPRRENGASLGPGVAAGRAPPRPETRGGRSVSIPPRPDGYRRVFCGWARPKPSCQTGWTGFHVYLNWAGIIHHKTGPNSPAKQGLKVANRDTYTRFSNLTWQKKQQSNTSVLSSHCDQNLRQLCVAGGKLAVRCAHSHFPTCDTYQNNQKTFMNLVSKQSRWQYQNFPVAYLGH